MVWPDPLNNNSNPWYNVELEDMFKCCRDFQNPFDLIHLIIIATPGMM